VSHTAYPLDPPLTRPKSQAQPTPKPSFLSVLLLFARMVAVGNEKEHKQMQEQGAKARQLLPQLALKRKRR
jgi:hypothetical protein